MGLDKVAVVVHCGSYSTTMYKRDDMKTNALIAMVLASLGSLFQGTCVAQQQLPFHHTPFSVTGHAAAEWDLFRNGNGVCSHDPSVPLKMSPFFPDLWFARARGPACEHSDAAGGSAKSDAESQIGTALIEDTPGPGGPSISMNTVLSIEGSRTESTQSSYSVNTKAGSKGKAEAEFTPNLLFPQIFPMIGGHVIVTGKLELIGHPVTFESDFYSPNWAAFVRCKAGETDISAVFFGTYWVVFGQRTVFENNQYQTENVFKIVNSLFLFETFSFADKVLADESESTHLLTEMGGDPTDNGEAVLDYASSGSDQDYESTWELEARVRLDPEFIDFPFIP